MSISFSGLGSGLDYASWIDSLVEIKQQSVTTIQNKNATIQKQADGVNSLKTAYKNLLDSITTLRDARFSSSNIFTKAKAVSSDDKSVTASVEAGTPAQSVSVIVKQLATKTSVESPSNVATAITGDTKYKDLAGGKTVAGKVSFNIDNEKLDIEIGANDTLNDIAQKFETAAAAVGKTLDVSIEDGKFKMTSDSQVAFTSAGTSDFISVLALKKNADSKGYTSLNPISTVNVNKALTGAESGISGLTEGEFSIGSATFTITSTTTMNGLISQINANPDAGVNASFDQSTGKLKLTSKTPGELYVSISAPSAENGGSNFTDVMGLTQNGSMILDNQVLGKNALFSINGEDKEYIGNVVPPSVSGVAGLTLTLNKVSEENKDTTIDVTADPSELSAALEKLVKNYNEVISLTNKMTKLTPSTVDGQTTYTKALLSFDASLTSMTSEIRSLVMGTSKNGDNPFSMLSQLGINTAKAGANVADAAAELTFDKEAFLKVFNENPDGVQKFLIGEGTDGNGFLTKVSKSLDNMLDFEKGYFAIKSNSLKEQMQNNSDRITRENTKIEAYRKSLEAKFTAMDLAIAKMNAQYSDISSILTQ